MSTKRPALYLVATPIGNLGDLSPRAAETLSSVDLILCEDTRTTRRLMSHFGIATRTRALHEHNETELATGIVQRMLNEPAAYALVSDAGTPAVSDPGYRLVAATHAAGVPVYSLPGPSAPLAAVAASGLPTDRFVFEGFLPPKAAARRSRIAELKHEPRTLVFLESCHRVTETLADLAELFGRRRPASAARELSKLHEQVLTSTLGELAEAIGTDALPTRGEFVLVVGGGEPPERTAEARRLLAALVPHLPVKQAAKVVAELTGERPNVLYELAQKLRDKTPQQGGRSKGQGTGQGTGKSKGAGKDKR